MKQNPMNQEPWTKEMLEQGILQLNFSYYSHIPENLSCIANICTNSCVFRYTDVSTCLQVCVCIVHAHPRVPEHVYVKRKIKNTFKEKQEKKMVFLVLGNQVLFLVPD